MFHNLCFQCGQPYETVGFLLTGQNVLTLLSTGATGKGQTRSDLLNIPRENPTTVSVNSSMQM
jgi:hypothetical protein